jgi:hypothetical protein
MDSLVVPQSLFQAGRGGADSNPPPTAEQVRSRRRRHRAGRLIVAAALVTGGAVLIDHWGTPTHSEVVAEKLVSSTVLPPGARRVSQPPTAELALSGDGSGCTPNADAARFWIVPGTVTYLVAFLETHRPAGMKWAGDGGTRWST